MTNAALIAKLERAQEGSGKLSCAVLVALGYKYRWQWNGGRWIAPDGSECRIIPQPDPTQNLQDIGALIEATGRHFTFRSYQKEADVHDPDFAQPTITGRAKTLCNAACIAILKAVETKDG
ncbi:MAG: hypothetical protein V3S55_06155 [Nitrospiraceae bacterium]